MFRSQQVLTRLSPPGASALRLDYTAIGTVSNVAARLCDEALPDQILISPRVLMAVADMVIVLCGQTGTMGRASASLLSLTTEFDHP